MPPELPLVEVGTDLTVQDQSDRIKVGELGAAGPPDGRAHGRGASQPGERDRGQSLMVGVNGRVAGLVHFRRSTRLTILPALERMRKRRNIQIGLFSELAPAGVARLATALSCDFHLADQADHDRVRFLRHCRQQGYRTLYVGDCRANPQVVAESHVSISLLDGEIHESTRDPAPVWLLQPRLAKLGVLWEVAEIHRRRLKVAHGYALLPNLLCVAGAFAWGFTSLASVLVSNLGTYGIYSRTKASLETLDRQIALTFGPRPCVTGDDRRVDRSGR